MPQPPARLTPRDILYCGPHRLEFLRRRRQKHIHLRVHRTGKILLTAGYRTPNSAIHHFLVGRERWLCDTLERLAQEERRWADWFLGSGGKVLFLGREFKICVEAVAPGGRPRVVTRGADLVVYEAGPVLGKGAVANSEGPPQEVLAARVRRQILSFFAQQAKLVLRHRVNIFASQLGVAPQRLRFSAQRSRWGSCSATGTISLNWGLALAPLAVIDYVVIHELAHLKHLNHSRKFWALVGEACPHFKDAKVWLRAHGSLIERLLFSTP